MDPAILTSEFKIALQSTFNIDQLSNVFDTLISIINAQSNDLSNLKGQLSQFRLEYASNYAANNRKIDELSKKSDANCESIDNIRIQQYDNFKEIQYQIGHLSSTENQKLNLFSLSASAPKLTKFRRTEAHLKYNKQLEETEKLSPRSAETSSMRKYQDIDSKNSKNASRKMEMLKLSLELKNAIPPSRDSYIVEQSTEEFDSQFRNDDSNDILPLDGDANQLFNNQLYSSQIDFFCNYPNFNDPQRRSLGSRSATCSRPNTGERTSSSTQHNRPQSAKPKLQIQHNPSRGTNGIDTSEAQSRRVPDRKNLTWLTNERRFSILAELRIRGQFIQAASNLDQGNSLSKVQSVEVMSSLLQNRLAIVEQEVAILAKKYDSHNQLQTNFQNQLQFLVESQLLSKQEKLQKQNIPLPHQIEMDEICLLIDQKLSEKVPIKISPSMIDENTQTIIDNPEPVAAQLDLIETAFEPIATAPLEDIIDVASEGNSDSFSRFTQVDFDMAIEKSIQGVKDELQKAIQSNREETISELTKQTQDKLDRLLSKITSLVSHICTINSFLGLPGMFDARCRSSVNTSRSAGSLNVRDLDISMVDSDIIPLNNSDNDNSGNNITSMPSYEIHVVFNNFKSLINRDVNMDIDLLKSELSELRNQSENLHSIASQPKYSDVEAGKQLRKMMEEFEHTQDAKMNDVITKKLDILSSMHLCVPESSDDRSMDLGVNESDILFLADNVRKISVEQATAISDMVKDLHRLEKEMAAKPSFNAIDDMVKLVETTFKRQLGENVVGLKVTVGQVIRAVQQKATKEDVLRLVADRLSAMQDGLCDSRVDCLHLGKDEHILAGSVKCISCGNPFMPISHDNRSISQSHTINKISRPATVSGPATSSTANSSIVSNNNRGTISSYRLRGSSDGLVDLIQSNSASVVGPGDKPLVAPLLRPLFLQDEPAKPLLRPNRTGTNMRTRSSVSCQEPLYRKARLASTIKELIKVPSAAITNHNIYRLSDTEPTPQSLRDYRQNKKSLRTGQLMQASSRGFQEFVPDRSERKALRRTLAHYEASINDDLSTLTPLQAGAALENSTISHFSILDDNDDELKH